MSTSLAQPGSSTKALNPAAPAFTCSFFGAPKSVDEGRAVVSKAVAAIFRNVVERADKEYVAKLVQEMFEDVVSRNSPGSDDAAADAERAFAARVVPVMSANVASRSVSRTLDVCTEGSSRKEEEEEGVARGDGKAAATLAPAGPVLEDACRPRVLCPAAPASCEQGAQQDSVRQVQDLLMAMMQHAVPYDKA